MAFTVRDFHDLIHLLDTNPEWRAQLLRVLFPEALLKLPETVEALAEAQRRTEAAIERLTERMERGFAEAAADRERIWQAIQETNERMERGFAEAAADRERIWEAIQETNERMERGFAEAAKDRERIWEAMERGFAEAAADRERIWEAIERGFAEAAANRERIWEAIRETNERIERIWQAIEETNARMEKGFAEAAAARARIERQLAEAAEDRTRIWEAIHDLQRDVRDLKGDAREQYYRGRASGIFGRRLVRGHDATSEVADQLYLPFQEGRLSTQEYDQVLAADLLWGGRLRETNEPVILVVEVSWRVEFHDVERAKERAAILRKAGFKALPVAAGQEWPEEVETLARREKVVIVQDGSVDEASWREALKVA